MVVLLTHYSRIDLVVPLEGIVYMVVLILKMLNSLLYLLGMVVVQHRVHHQHLIG